MDVNKYGELMGMLMSIALTTEEEFTKMTAKDCISILNEIYNEDE